MREIKFRAWEKTVKEMIPVYSINFEMKMINMNSAWRNFYEIELMQFTGLHDINGKEIYDGDLCQLGTTLYQIVWMDRYAKYGVHVVKTESRLSRGCTFPLQDYVMFESGNCNFEIIGNIYKNPEMLK